MCRLSSIPGSLKQNLEKKRLETPSSGTSTVIGSHFVCRRINFPTSRIFGFRDTFLNNRMIFLGSRDSLIPCLQKAVEPGPVSYK